MSRLPIRVRLALVFAAAMAVVLAGAGTFLYLRVGSDLDRTLDQELQARAQDVSALVRRRGSLRSTSGPLIENGESFAELVDANGAIVDATQSIGRQRLLTRAQLRRARREPVYASRPSVRGAFR